MYKTTRSPRRSGPWKQIKPVAMQDWQVPSGKKWGGTFTRFKTLGHRRNDPSWHWQGLGIVVTTWKVCEGRRRARHPFTAVSLALNWPTSGQRIESNAGVQRHMRVFSNRECQRSRTVRGSRGIGPITSKPPTVSRLLVHSITRPYQYRSTQPTHANHSNSLVCHGTGDMAGVWPSEKGCDTGREGMGKLFWSILVLASNVAN